MYSDTPEQSLIINYRGNRLVVKAYAGTGKTSVLIKYALKNPTLKMLYLAYGRAIRDEAVTRFPKNVECKTSHQLAYAEFGHQFDHKLAGNLRLTEVADAIGSKNWTFAKDIVDTLNAFMCSADRNILVDHFARADTGKALSSKQMQYLDQVMDGANAIWARMTNPKDPFPAVHDCYLKLFQLSMPNLGNRYSVILFDEAQDANPVTSSIVRQQQCRVIRVGDRHQQIFRFRGAVNALDSKEIESTDVLYLTNSFRFGPQIALVANAILEYKGETRPVVGRGAADSVSRFLPADIRGKTVLCRTVMGVIEKALAATAKGEKVFWIGGIESYKIGDLLDVYHLSTGNLAQIKNRKLTSEYKSYSNYLGIAEATSDPEMLRANKIIENTEALPQRFQRLYDYSASSMAEADITLSTVHRSKGLEFDYVQLHDDFPDIFDGEMEPKAIEDELNLLYVGVTRAKKHLAYNDRVEAIARIVAARRLKQQKAVTS